jgi:membrane protease YdiL (CAAX protease family)
MNKSKIKRNLIIFITITLTSGWLGVFVDTLLTEQPEGDTLGMGMWLVLPLLSAIVLSIVGRDWKNAGLTPRFKGNIKWYLFSLIVFPLAALISLGIAMIFGAVELSGINISKILPLIAVGFGINIIKNIFEEFAWRGYFTPKLIELKANDWVLYLISGLVWALWHLPYYLVFINDDGIFESLFVSRIGFALIAIVAMSCWNILYVEMFRLTKTVWTCTVMHAAEDGFVAFLFMGGYYTFTGGTNLWIFDPHVGILATIMILAAGLILRKIRLKRELIRKEV